MTHCHVDGETNSLKQLVSESCHGLTKMMTDQNRGGIAGSDVGLDDSQLKLKLLIPHFALGALLILLAVASFINYHFKNKENKAIGKYTQDQKEAIHRKHKKPRCKPGFPSTLLQYFETGLIEDNNTDASYLSPKSITKKHVRHVRPGNQKATFNSRRTKSSPNFPLTVSAQEAIVNHVGPTQDLGHADKVPYSLKDNEKRPKIYPFSATPSMFSVPGEQILSALTMVGAETLAPTGMV